MKAVLISIQPYWVFLIIARKMGWDIDKEKTIEVRKNFPKDKDWNRNVEIYCSKDKKSFSKIPKEYQPLMAKFLGKVIGEFVCDEITEYRAEFTDLQYSDARHKKVCQNTIKWVERDDENEETVYRYETSNEEDDPDNCKFLKRSCLTFNEVRKYIGETFFDKPFYGWHISDLKIYDKPKELREFRKACPYTDGSYCLEQKCEHYDDYSGKCCCVVERPPQSWCYVEELKSGKID